MDTKEFFAYIRTNPLLFRTGMTDEQTVATLDVLSHLEDRQVEDDRVIAYVCATAFHDSNESMSIATSRVDTIIDGAGAYFTEDLTDWTGARTLVSPDGSDAALIAQKAIAFRSAVIHASKDIDE